MARRTKYQRERDLAELARRYLKGEHQVDIAADLNVTQQTISNDLKTLQKRWQDSALIDVDAAKARELARIDNLEREYWEGWERSCAERKIASAEVKPGVNQGKPTKTSVRKEDRDGNTAFLRGIEWCIERRCKLLGLDAPARTQHSGPDGGPISIRQESAFDLSKLSEEELRALDAITAKLEDQGGAG